MSDLDYFTRERAISIMELMQKRCRENPTPLIQEVATGANSHSLEMALFAIDLAIQDMKDFQKIEALINRE